jgi:hypothetical protein
MKRLVFFLLAALTLISCEDTETNQVALQAKVDNTLYESTDARAALNEDGSLTIQGFTQDESLTLHLKRLSEGDFEIAEGRPNYAIFEDMGGNIYTTSPDGEGQITISEINEGRKTLSGTFNFNAFLPGIDTIYVSRGVLYDVPYGGGEIGDPSNVGTFSAKVDGDPFVTVIVAARNTGNSIVVSGSTVNATISITMPSAVESGQYTLPQAAYKAKFRDDSVSQSANEGVIEVLEHDPNAKTISGTFSFITDTKEITNGKFNVTYD